jgi:hypothetical protein
LDSWWVQDNLLEIVQRQNFNFVGSQYVHIIGDSRAIESDGGVLQEFLEQLRHAIGPTYLEDQYLGRHRELKDGGTLIAPTLARVGELCPSPHT